MTISDQYQALKNTGVIGAVSLRGAIGVSGRDRASYLQGLLTNDIPALTPGSGCYAAWLTAQGRMLTDMHVFESGEMILLDVPASQLSSTLQRLDQFLFGEDVQLVDLSAALTAVWIHGPAAPAMLERVLSGAGGANTEAGTTLGSRPAYRNARASFGDAAVVIARVDQLGVPGFCVYIEPAQVTRLKVALVAEGAVEAEAEAIDAARIEAGYPVFGTDMTDETIPLEAGIEHRAISLTKGCYVGQEVIIRVLHRGGGRVVKRLVGLRIDGDVPGSGAKILAGEKEIGVVTSAVRSPRLGTIALGYVHRDFTTSGTAVLVNATPAVVSDLPLV
ncbi:MAG: folate-binding protein YgfZ [Acidobacteria bacterium]|nr:folate-binding protein YgfZ [Acidobacteriota bacterium]